MPMHAPLQQHPNVAPHADSNGCHLLARKTRVLLAHCAACSEQWHAPPFIVWKGAERRSKIAVRKKHISCIVLYCWYVYQIIIVSLYTPQTTYLSHSHICRYIYIYRIFMYHNIMSYHITSNIHIIFLSTKNTSFLHLSNQLACASRARRFASSAWEECPGPTLPPGKPPATAMARVHDTRFALVSLVAGCLGSLWWGHFLLGLGITSGLQTLSKQQLIGLT